MSMFYELMMRKKTQIMYATIKGSLTENDGVFSGFSASNYLLTQDNIAINTNQNFEIRVTFTTGGDVSSFKHLLETYGHPYDFYIDFKDDRFRFKFFDVNNTSVIYTLWHSITTNTQYTVIWQYISATNTHNISLVQNGVVIASNSNTSTIYSYNYPFAIGCSDIVGSIDLNNSYIKIGSTKYKLQAVVGYTVVGSPTITDGVVSGFSSANYLNLGANVPYSNNFEMVFKFTTGTIGTTQAIFEGTTSNTGATIIISTNGKLFVSAGNGSWIVNTAGTTVLSANTTYYIKFSYKNNVYKLELSTDNVNWNTEISVESSSTISTTSNKSIGYSTRFSGRVFTGSIDMNNTYIKINNKLWFNGQQA